MSEKKVENGKPRIAFMAPGLTAKELKNLRAQIDKALLDPDYVIITNYMVSVLEFQLPTVQTK